MAAGRVALSGREYPKSVRDNIRADIKQLSDPRMVHNHFLQELARYPIPTDVEDEHVLFLTDPSLRPNVGFQTLTEFDRTMRKMAGSGMGRGSTKIKNFFNTFVLQAETNRLSASQCMAYLPTYFDDTLSSQVLRTLRRLGLLEGLKQLRLLLCPTTSLDVCKHELAEILLKSLAFLP